MEPGLNIHVSEIMGIAKNFEGGSLGKKLAIFNLIRYEVLPAFFGLDRGYLRPYLSKLVILGLRDYYQD